MKPFSYATALTPESARELAGQEGAYLAGGNDLLGLMKESILAPKLLVNIKPIPGFNAIEQTARSWILGATTTLAQIENHAGLRQACPGLHQAVAEVGSLQIRNVATIGGNLAQHSRCWYFRHRDLVCWKKGGDTCLACEGENRYHSIFTGCACISPVVSNLSVVLAALGATVHVRRGDQTLKWSIHELYAQAWDDPSAHHSLGSGDLILKIEIPADSRRSAYLQASEKAQFDWALVSCAASAQVDQGRFSRSRIVLGAVAPVPYQVNEANQMLDGQAVDEALAAQAADRLLRDATPVAHNKYKVAIAKALIVRTLLLLRS